MALEHVSSIKISNAAKQGRVLVIVRAYRLRHLLLEVLGQAGYAQPSSATLAEAGHMLGQRGAAQAHPLEWRGG